MEKTWKPVVSGILTIIAGCMGIGGGISIIRFSLSLIDMPGIYERIADMIQRANALGMPISVASRFGFIPLVFGIMAVIGGYHALRRIEWGWALAGSILAIPIGVPLGIISTVFLANSRNEFK